MHIATWNVYACSPEKAQHVTVQSVINHMPDICVLTEVVSGASEKALQRGFESFGYHTLSANVVSQNIDAKGVLIISKEPIFNRSIQGMEHWGRKCISARTFGIEVVGVYFPQLNDRSEMLLSLSNGTRSILDNDAVILGDFNMGVRVADGFSSDSYTKRGKFHGVHEHYEHFHAHSGWVDVWRRNNPTEFSVGSWLSPNNHFRIDNMFFSKSLAPKVKEVNYSHKEREGINRPSDHSLMWAIVDHK